MSVAPSYPAQFPVLRQVTAREIEEIRMMIRLSRLLVKVSERAK